MKKARPITDFTEKSSIDFRTKKGNYRVKMRTAPTFDFKGKKAQPTSDFRNMEKF